MKSERKKQVIDLLPGEEKEALSADEISIKYSLKKNYTYWVLSSATLHPRSDKDRLVKRKKVDGLYRYWQSKDITSDKLPQTKREKIVAILPCGRSNAISEVGLLLKYKETYGTDFPPRGIPPIVGRRYMIGGENYIALWEKREKMSFFWRERIDTTPEDSACKALQGSAYIFGREGIDGTPEITPKETSLSVTKSRKISIDTIEGVLSNYPDSWLSARQILEKLGYNLSEEQDRQTLINKVTNILKHLRYIGRIDRRHSSVVGTRSHLLYRYSVPHGKDIDVVIRGSQYIERLERVKDLILELLPSNEQEGITKEEIINHIGGEEERNISSALIQLQQHGEITEKGLKFWSPYKQFYNWRIRHVKRDILARLPFERERALTPQEVANSHDFFIKNDDGTAYIDNERYLHHCIEVIDALEELYHSHDVDKYYWHGGRYRYWRIKQGEQQMLEQSRSGEGIEEKQEDKIMEDVKIHTELVSDANVLEVQVGTNTPRGGDAWHGGRTIFGIKDRGGTGWDVCVKTHVKPLPKDNEYIFEQPEAIRITLYGDAEARTFLRCLDFASGVLGRGDKVDINWEKIEGRLNMVDELHKVNEELREALNNKIKENDDLRKENEQKESEINRLRQEKIDFASIKAEEIIKRDIESSRTLLEKTFKEDRGGYE